MSQSVNFLKTIPKSTSRLTATKIGLIAFALLFILMIISIIQGFINLKLQKSLEKAQKDLQVLQENYDKLAKAYPLLVGDIPFVKRIKNIEDEFQSKKAQIETLEHLIRRRGFSQYMFDLAQTTPRMLWLNQIQIDHDFGSVTLSGYTIDPDTVSELMSQLFTTNSFKNVIFKLFFVKTIKEHPYLKFSIATNTLGPQEETMIEQNNDNQNTQGVK